MTPEELHDWRYFAAAALASGKDAQAASRAANEMVERMRKMAQTKSSAPTHDKICDDRGKATTPNGHSVCMSCGSVIDPACRPKPSLADEARAFANAMMADTNTPIDTVHCAAILERMADQLSDRDNAHEANTLARSMSLVGTPIYRDYLSSRLLFLADCVEAGR